MNRTTLLIAAAATAVIATPSLAKDRRTVPVYSDYNPYYLDYKTDISEAKRELRKDLARADDAADREDAWAEYRREIADAKHDFRKEMAERGMIVRNGRVTVEE
ncbi:MULTISPECIES: hypothetical protein [Sphingomonas]|jgi:hypothetical protein|uniref:Uncharacterized protein n=1 Tax=Sphingomonas hankookensis TaxID=563996 RepID=A0ABR5YDQ6_9SPHN|nr:MULTISPECIES: hypothetical protein [Sphingomonas]KZE16318.1 hypothetical protein AVT10_12545 [Sphingomonas hankookensis]PZT92832.1 MAG: hypothetical protein DI625_12065 [Sphingomonas sp.]RSV31812.1 hypothetical protein CA237_05040 [Sphingomonas sp. ABOLH]WCP71451.1 hypothetical protein PPZ50_13990 [Sphingomonas hankookensis]